MRPLPLTTLGRQETGTSAPWGLGSPSLCQWLSSTWGGSVVLAGPQTCPLQHSSCPPPGQGLEIPSFLSNHLHGPVWDQSPSVPRLLRTPETEGLLPGGPPLLPLALGAWPRLSVLVSGHSPPSVGAAPPAAPTTSCSPLPTPSMLHGPRPVGLGD